MALAIVRPILILISFFSLYESSGAWELFQEQHVRLSSRLLALETAHNVRISLGIFRILQY